MDKVKTWSRRAAAALAVLWGGATAPVLHAAEIVVGQVAPLTGVLASTGAQMVLGGKIYFDWVNAQGGVHGASIRQSVVDDAYKVADTVKATRELLAKPEVVALYGFAGTANITQLLFDGVLEQGGGRAGGALYGGRIAAQPVQPLDFPCARGLRRRGRAHGATAHHAGHEPRGRDVPGRRLWPIVWRMRNLKLILKIRWLMAYIVLKKYFAVT